MTDKEFETNETELSNEENTNEGNTDEEKADEEKAEYTEEMGEEVKKKDFEALLEIKENEIADLENKLARLQADFQNYKKRSDREREQSVSYGVEAVILDLLPVVDNFQRAILTCEDKTNGFYQGVEMIEKQLLDLLSSNSVQEIPALGEKFDPNLHHAVSVVESDIDSETVIEVLQKGYIFKDKVIRPAMVIVSK
ncbi:nucleotide exchange factor GrpE [Gudongella oleilytica]|jgi:molecular chaperone GrpE|uniref:nucleotide exchange factor GrpE n=1 Tax=Gudongella oleilytica TaxID=1582259 RepID=UPI000ECC5019|nr:nucleotide exchange factor GrpE [Gudongella oleilytica]MDY0255615.1 nucleotide exchange factor GrpE [Gudongella oleilytica]HCO19251.1 nucleotide exchange factor GrpE [Tissierellales bacterium]HMM69007.1 nucleotide exchange factor GrpE [Gudongella oleilytica]